MTNHQELETFKTAINLTHLMACFGYARDPKTSSPNSCTMVHPDGDKLVVSRGHDGHWIYFSVRDHTDSGTVIDFVQRRTGENLGQVRKRLREWLGSPSSTALGHPPALIEQSRYAKDLEPITRDLMLVHARYSAMATLGTHHPYLCEARRIPSSLLGLDRFNDQVRTDDRGNAVFPHFDEKGLCGYEIKNTGYTGFAKGGTKGLWSSKESSSDMRLVIAETAIDALSHAAIQGSERTRYVSTAGELNPVQPALLAQAIMRLPEQGTVIVAFDNDDGGDR